VGFEHGAHPEGLAQFQQEIVLVGGVDHHAIACLFAPDDEYIVVDRPHNVAVHFESLVSPMWRHGRMVAPDDMSTGADQAADSSGTTRRVSLVNSPGEPQNQQSVASSPHQVTSQAGQRCCPLAHACRSSTRDSLTSITLSGCRSRIG